MRGTATRFILTLLFLLCAGLTNAQLKYSFSATSGNAFDSLAAPTAFTSWTVGTSGTPKDEAYSSATAIGFSFTYNGVAYTDFQTSTNGFIRLGTTLATTNATNDLDGTLRRVIAPYWDDLAVDSANFDINYQLTGSAPNRVLTVEWKNAHLNYAQAANRYRFQVKLYETSNLVSFVYGGGHYTGAAVTTASIGLNNEEAIVTTALATGTFMSVNKADSVGANYMYSNCWEFTGNTYFPDSGTVMTFTPVTPSAIAGGTYTVGSGGTYPTLSAAANALNVNGIAGAVRLEILDGTYNDVFHLVNVAGTSATNTITVTKNSGTVTISPKYGAGTGNTVTTADAMFKLEGTQYVTIDGLSFVENAANWTTTKKFEVAVYLNNSMKITLESGITASGARFNTMKNLTIDMNCLSGTANSNAIGIRIGTNGTNADSSVTNSYNTIQDCDIQDFWRAAVLMYGFTGSTPDRGNKITAVVGRNAFHNVNITAGAQLDTRAIETNAEADLTIEKTDIYDISSSINTTNGLWGMRLNPASGTDDMAGTMTIRNNKIYNITMSATTVTSGFCAAIEANVTRIGSVLNIYNNEIYNIYSNGSTTCRAIGMQLNLANANGPNTLNLYNNLLYNIRAPRSTGTPGVRGFDIQAGSSYLTANVYNNTVYLDSTAAAAVATSQSACLHIANFGTSTLDLRNNILVNTLPSGATGRAPALFATANSNLVRLAPTSNNNLYYVGATPYSTKPIVWDGATAFTTMDAYRAALATAGLGGPREQSSVYEMPPFVSAVSPYNVHLTPGATTLAESGGQALASVTTDYDGDARGTTPDIGADEFVGVAATDNVAPVMNYTALSNTSSTANRTITVSITDPSTVGANRMYYKKHGETTWIYDESPVVSGNNYTYTFNYLMLSDASVTVGDTIEYYFAAQDNSVAQNLVVSPYGVATGVTPPGATIADTTKIRSYRITSPAMAGTYTVGVAMFNKIAKTNLVPVPVKKVVKEKVNVERSYTPPAPEQFGEMFAYTDPTVPGHIFDYAVDETQFEPYQMVEREFTIDTYELMENGSRYEGENFIAVNKDMLESRGIDTKGIENIEGVYTTITAALTDMNSIGISGPVTLSLVDATYTTETLPLTFNNVTGVSSTNTITVKPASGVTASITGGSLNGVFRIIGTNYVTIDGSNAGSTDKSLTLNNTTNAARVVWIGSNSPTVLSNITLKNVVLNGADTTTTAVMISDATTSGYPGYFNNITIENNTMKRARYGVFAIGGNEPYIANGSNLSILNNDMNAATAGDSIKQVGIYVQSFNGVTIRGNDIGGFGKTHPFNSKGMWLASGSKNVTVEKNKIHDLTVVALGNGANGLYVSPTIYDANIVIKNNFFYNITGTGSSTVNQNPVGVYVTGSTNGVKVYNNSFYLTGATLSNTASSAAYSAAISLSTYAKVDARNNAIYNTLGKTVASVNQNGTMGIFAFQTMNQFTNLDYNLYYIGSVNGTYASYAHVNGVSDLGLTFSEYKSLWGLDTHSRLGDARFVDGAAGNLLINTAVKTPTANRGVALAEVTDDYEGNARTATPDIGADEHTGEVLPFTLNVTTLIEGLYDAGTGLTVRDTVTINVKSNTAPYTTLLTGKAYIGTDGVGSYEFPTLTEGDGSSYYLNVVHRNAVETYNASPEYFEANPASFDFSSAASQAAGSNLILKGTKYCIYSGDVNQDQFVDFSDLTLIDNDSYNFTGGYVATDLNGDEFVDFSDLTICDNNSYAFIGTVTPGGKKAAGNRVLRPNQVDNSSK